MLNVCYSDPHCILQNYTKWGKVISRQKTFQLWKTIKYSTLSQPKKTMTNSDMIIIIHSLSEVLDRDLG